MMQSATVVAEIGVNFRGMREAKRMISMAHVLGADAVKFQVYDDAAIEGHPRYDELKSIQLSKKRIKDLSKFCYSVGIDFFATPMFPEAVDWLAPHVNRYKVRYEDRHNVELFKKIAQSNIGKDDGGRVVVSNKSVIISCDDSYFTDKHPATAEILTLLRRGEMKYKYMLCTRTSGTNQIPMPQAFHVAKYTGYSSHSSSMAAPLAAIMRGASIVEVHLKKAKYSNDWQPFDDDSAMSLTEFEKFINIKNDLKRIL